MALADALRTGGVHVTPITLHGSHALEDNALAQPPENPAPDDYDRFNLLCVNADSVLETAGRLGQEFFSGRYTIGFWAWEVSQLPSRFAPAFDPVDEIWVGSRHVRDAIAPMASVPVVVIPQPVSLPARAAESPPPAHLPDGFRFLFAFDYLSVFERKNPLAVIEAFRRAFSPSDGAALIIKSLNHERDPSAHVRLRAAAAEHTGVHLIEHRLTTTERDGLMNAADCYVSLHRAEGFGYTLAEAMWLGKPVIATDYSGNTDFMNSGNSYPVRHELTPIGAGNEPYPAEGYWADPDTGHAAQLMRGVFEHPEEGRRRGTRAAADIRASHGLQVAGQAMIERLDVVRRSSRWSARVEPAGRLTRPIATAAIEERIVSGPIPSSVVPRFGTPQRLARRGMLRLLKPLSVHTQLVDRQLLDAIRSLEARLQSISSDQAIWSRRVDELEAQLARLSAEVQSRTPAAPVEGRGTA